MEEIHIEPQRMWLMLLQDSSKPEAPYKITIWLVFHHHFARSNNSSFTNQNQFFLPELTYLKKIRCLTSFSITVELIMVGKLVVRILAQRMTTMPHWMNMVIMTRTELVI